MDSQVRRLFDLPARWSQVSTLRLVFRSFDPRVAFLEDYERKTVQKWICTAL